MNVFILRLDELHRYYQEYTSMNIYDELMDVQISRDKVVLRSFEFIPRSIYSFVGQSS